MPASDHVEDLVEKTQFVNYDKKCAQGYDSVRNGALGVDVILGALALAESSDKGLSDMYVLDAGCGTGNYIQHTERHVGKIHAQDLNAGMLDRAKDKFKDNQKVVVEDSPSSADNIPLEDCSVDGIMCNQVVQHVESDETRDDRTMMKKIFKEFYRVLKPGGMCVISTRSKMPQYSDLYWYASLAPKACQMMEKKVPSRDEVISAMEEAGLQFKSSVTPHFDMIMQNAAYYDGAGPLNDSWRCGDSWWSLVDEEEIKGVKEAVQEKIDNGTIDAYIKERDVLRTTRGQTLFVSAMKPKTA